MYYRKRARFENLSKYLWVAAKYRAKKRGVKFSITVADVVVPERCPVLGIPMDSRDRNHAPSIDEVVQGFGYVKGNVAVISGRANRIKSDATLEVLQAVEAYVRLRTHPMYGKKLY
jgi:hypothetical protein